MAAGPTRAAAAQPVMTLQPPNKDKTIVQMPTKQAIQVHEARQNNLEHLPNMLVVFLAPKVSDT